MNPLATLCTKEVAENKEEKPWGCTVTTAFVSVSVVILVKQHECICIYIFTYPGIPKTIETIIGFQWLSPRTIFCREFESSKIGDYYLDDF